MPDIYPRVQVNEGAALTNYELTSTLLSNTVGVEENEPPQLNESPYGTLFAPAG